VQRPTPTKEQQLLFDLLKGAIPSDLEGIDSAVLFQLFQRHRLFPMATELLPLLEEEERARWKQVIQIRTVRSMHHFAMLGKLIQALYKSGIEAISLKGPVLAYTLMGNIVGRHSSDLDILIRYEDLQHCIEILGREGYKLTYPKPDLTERQWRYYSRFKKDVHLINKDQGILLELHYNIENYLGLKSTELDVFFQDIMKVNIGGSFFSIMQNHHTFLYLMVHGAVHQYRRLFWLRDIAEGLKQWDLDHKKILYDAKTMGIERMIGFSVGLAGEMFSVKLPEVYCRYLNDNKKVIEKLKKASLQIILGPEFLTLKGKMNHHFFMLRSKPELRHYFRTMLEIMNRQYIGKYLGGH